MTRMTRKKAAEVAGQPHVDEDALLVLPGDDAAMVAAKAKATTPEPNSRPPLGEIAPNSAETTSQSSEDNTNELKKSTRGRRGGKKGGAKTKKYELARSTTNKPDAPDDHNTPEVLPDDLDSAPSPASEKAVEELSKDIPALTFEDTTTNDSPTSATHLTRSQAQPQAEQKSLIDGLGQTPEELAVMKEETVLEHVPAIETTVSNAMDIKHASPPMLDAPASPLPTANPITKSYLRVDTPGKRSTSNKENIEPESMTSPTPSSYDALEEAVIASSITTPQQRASPARAEDHIAALDELNDAVDNVSKDIPEVQTTPAKPKSSRTSQHAPAAVQDAETTSSGAATIAKPPTPPKKKEKPAPVVRTTKAAAARISMAHNKDATVKAPSLGRPQQSMALRRSSSVRESTGPKAAVPGRRIASASSAKEEGERKEVVIPHSKPRPISISFPTPPPPPKSTKAPTQSTFQLPGEAVAAKLRAAREARQQKEAQEQEKKVFKARPVPATLSKAPSVRQTNASRARESIMTGKDLKRSQLSLSGPAHGRAHSVATTRPSDPKPRIVSAGTAKPSVNGVKPSSSSRPRPSTAMANISKPRASMSSSLNSTTRAPSNPITGPTKGTTKGKEVFHRAAVAKANADKEKFDRGEAAKKARAEAAERSRQLSREFAEKQRLKKMAAAGAKEKPASNGLEKVVEADAEPVSTATGT